MIGIIILSTYLHDIKHINIFEGIGAISVVLALISFIIPNLACAVRRLHDTNTSGWMLFLIFVPIAKLYLIHLLYKDSVFDDKPECYQQYD